MGHRAAVSIVLSFLFLACLTSSCSKPLASAKVRTGSPEVSRDYAALPNDIYYATRWALVEAGYAVALENLQDGVIMTSWEPVRSDSHFIPLFDRKDYGVTNSYHQLEIKIVPGGGRTDVKITSRVKSLAARIKSTGIEEKKILDGIGNYLRKTEPSLTNLGVSE
ncbi:MAG TPA: hypothetical protein PLZ86_06875 [bacterium]|nr:hypothetical protein [bacterium]